MYTCVCQDRNHNLWDPVQNENVGPLVKIFGELYDGDRCALNQESGQSRLAQEASLGVRVSEGAGLRCKIIFFCGSQAHRLQAVVTCAKIPTEGGPWGSWLRTARPRSLVLWSAHLPSPACLCPGSAVLAPTWFCSAPGSQLPDL